MVLGRAGLRLEAQKFVVYVGIPIVASVAYNEPSVQKWSADYFQFMKYPSNPKTNLKEEFEQLQKEREEQLVQEKRNRKGREEYLSQLKKLSLERGKGSGNSAEADGETVDQKRGWFRWWRWGRRSDPSVDSDNSSKSI
mmetsp:Transcript_30519/g.64293  ORF Transcript_30519/g.64293 Transcript_30519/m.64293 type:complete len:139 (+) Transcript_30519:372-788(+)